MSALRSVGTAGANLLKKDPIAQWLPDSSVKPGEAQCDSLVPDLQRIAGSTVEKSIVAHSPNDFSAFLKNALPQKLIFAPFKTAICSIKE